jgi:hypothetical protein
MVGKPHVMWPTLTFCLFCDYGMHLVSGPDGLELVCLRCGWIFTELTIIAACASERSELR